MNIPETVRPDELKPLLKSLREQGFTCLMCVTAVDRPAENRIEALYFLCSDDNRKRREVRVGLDRTGPRLPTVSDLFRAAEWHEREAAEMFGITFTDHPDPRRLLLPDEVRGFPLRKDFTDDFLIPLPTGKKEE
jgi:NADH-quinone oxidoreductase subunit C